VRLVFDTASAACVRVPYHAAPAQESAHPLEAPLSTFRRRSASVLAVATLAGGGLACGSSTTADPGSATTTTASAPGTTAGPGPIAVTMKEWTVEPAAASAPAGEVTFAARNAGEKTHELVLFKTDLAAEKLPLDEDGAVDEEGAGLELMNEVEDVGVGETKSFSADVVPGHYYLVCNVIDPDTGDKHFGHKMYAAFTVT
jgi:hypothetical protein